MKKRVGSIVGLVMLLVAQLALLVLPLPAAAQEVLGCSMTISPPWANQGSVILVTAAGGANCSPAAYHALKVTLQKKGWTGLWYDAKSVNGSGTFGNRWRSVSDCKGDGYYRTKVTLDGHTITSSSVWLACHW